jgi:hypothetical protein
MQYFNLIQIKNQIEKNSKIKTQIIYCGRNEHISN